MCYFLIFVVVAVAGCHAQAPAQPRQIRWAILAFGSVRCSGCQVDKPIIDRMQMGDSIVGYEDVSTNRGSRIANEFGVTSVPFYIIFNDTEGPFTEFDRTGSIDKALMYWKRNHAVY